MGEIATTGRRSLGLFGSIGIGVGSIVGGSILVLTGISYTAAGPGAILAFILNGVIAIITAFSFAELSAAFPESGGPYVYAKKLLSIKAAFAIGWLLWFASMVASVLYALGAGYFATLLIKGILDYFPGVSAGWLTTASASQFIAGAAIVYYTVSLMLRPASGGAFANIGKIVAFAVLILGGVWAMTGESPESIRHDFSPLLPFGFVGVVEAMGYTFIAFHGFELIAAVAGEVKDPDKTIPRAMIISILISLAIYVPLVFIVTVAGTEHGQSIVELSTQNPESVIAVAAERYMGKAGYWIVVIAGILSMLSALYANILAPSRIAESMARDRTLPRPLGEVSTKWGTPDKALLATSAIIIATLILVPDVNAAGAAASLIFLLAFAVTQGIAILARKRRTPRPGAFRIPFFPYLPMAGIVICSGIVIFEGIKVPEAGIIAAIWLAIGGVLYFIHFGRSARIFDASSEGYDPELVKLRGRNPLFLVPIANPTSAKAMIEVAAALAPPEYGKVLLLSVVTTGEETPVYEEDRIMSAQTVLREAISTSLEIGLSPEALITIAERPWPEIVRVARTYRCESLLIGLTSLTQKSAERNLERLVNAVPSNVVMLKAPRGWHIHTAKRILVPVAGRGSHGELLARILGSISRTGGTEVTFLRILPEDTDWRAGQKARSELFHYAEDHAGHVSFKVRIEKSGDIAGHIIELAEENDLVILGIHQSRNRKRSLGGPPLRIIRESPRPVLMISRGG